MKWRAHELDPDDMSEQVERSVKDLLDETDQELDSFRHAAIARARAARERERAIAYELTGPGRRDLRNVRQARARLRRGRALRRLARSPISVALLAIAAALMLLLGIRAYAELIVWLG